MGDAVFIFPRSGSNQSGEASVDNGVAGPVGFRKLEMGVSPPRVARASRPWFGKPPDMGKMPMPLCWPAEDNRQLGDALMDYGAFRLSRTTADNSAKTAAFGVSLRI